MFTFAANGLQKSLDQVIDLERKHIPVAAARALTMTAYDVRARLRQEMESVFDRPTIYTLNSLMVYPASRNRLVSRVWMKSEADKGEPATRWLEPEIYGGPRLQKRMERQLKERGILPSGKYVLPGAGAKLDAHGNISRGQVAKAMSGIRGNTSVGYSANATDSKRSMAKGNGRRYFVMRRGGENIGIAERTAKGRGGVQIILAFAERPSYSKALRFFEIADSFAEQQLPIRFKEALAVELRHG